LCEEGLTKSLRKVGVIGHTRKTVVKSHHFFPRKNPYAKWQAERAQKALKTLLFRNEKNKIRVNA
jgi:hypothetical protein